MSAVVEYPNLPLRAEEDSVKLRDSGNFSKLMVEDEDRSSQSAERRFNKKTAWEAKNDMLPHSGMKNEEGVGPSDAGADGRHGRTENAHYGERGPSSLNTNTSDEQGIAKTASDETYDEFESAGSLTDECLETAFQASKQLAAPTNSSRSISKLPQAKMIELASSSSPVPMPGSSLDFEAHTFNSPNAQIEASTAFSSKEDHGDGGLNGTEESRRTHTTVKPLGSAFDSSPILSLPSFTKDFELRQPQQSNYRPTSTPVHRRSPSNRGSGPGKESSKSTTKQRKPTPAPLSIDDTKAASIPLAMEDSAPSPMPTSIPVPPLSFPTYLQLELSSQNPSPLYIHRSTSSDFPYESSRVKIDRLLNFLLLPPQLEQVLWFGALACLDAWLYSFTILPLRFFKALSILAQSWSRNIASETRFVAAFIYAGLGRMWRRRRQAIVPASPASKSFKEHLSDEDRDKAFVPGSIPRDKSVVSHISPDPKPSSHRHSSTRRHRRTKSTPSALLPDHKADLLKGFLIILSCIILMLFDASRMYHSIRGQAAIKLYVIYNVLEVCDRLFSALGQDVLECLFSNETLERNPNGRSKILRPLWLFFLALAYNLIHATSLFYQVITLNVAVNSYSNALLTLLMSNQFVEIKSTVFKRFEKENLFQLTCADVVERFQLWLMLVIIASRNIIETGSLMPILSPSSSSSSTTTTSSSPNLLPKSFTVLPSLSSLSGQVLGPFLLVLGSEMLVDWLKHAYITKFNNTKPAIYGRFLDILCKDYYSNAFADQDLTRRLGLPVIPLACLFIRASVQTYHMFLATHKPSPLPPPSPSPASSTPTSLNLPPTTTTFPFPLHQYLPAIPFSLPSLSTLLNPLPTLLFLLVTYLTLLSLKLLLGISLLHYARNRYRGMKSREASSSYAEGRRVGGWGVVEVGEERRRWIYEDEPGGKERVGGREREERRRADEGGAGLGGVQRYAMAGKRIW